MEDNLNSVENGRWFQKLATGRTLQYFGKWKTTSIFWQIEDHLNIPENGRRLQNFANVRRHQNLPKGRRLQNLANGRQPQYLGWWKMTRICGHIKGNLNVFYTWKITSTFIKVKTTSMFWPMEDNLNILANGRWHQCFTTGRWPQLLSLAQLAPAWPELGAAQPQLVFIFL